MKIDKKTLERWMWQLDRVCSAFSYDYETREIKGEFTDKMHDDLMAFSNEIEEIITKGKNENQEN